MLCLSSVFFFSNVGVLGHNRFPLYLRETHALQN